MQLHIFHFNSLYYTILSTYLTWTSGINKNTHLVSFLYTGTDIRIVAVDAERRVCCWGLKTVSTFVAGAAQRSDYGSAETDRFSGVTKTAAAFGSTSHKCLSSVVIFRWGKKKWKLWHKATREKLWIGASHFESQKCLWALQLQTHRSTEVTGVHQLVTERVLRSALRCCRKSAPAPWSHMEVF